MLPPKYLSSSMQSNVPKQLFFFSRKYCDWPACLWMCYSLSTAKKMHYRIIITTNGPCLSITNSLIGTVIFSVDAPEKSLNAGEHYAATGSKPLCLRSGSGEGSRPRNETNTCSQWRALVWLPAIQRTQNKFVSQIIW